eukprot:5065965-Amphidinium_carterae.1
MAACNQQAKPTAMTSHILCHWQNPDSYRKRDGFIYMTSCCRLVGMWILPLQQNASQNMELHYSTSTAHYISKVNYRWLFYAGGLL